VHTLEQVSAEAIHLGTPPHRSWHLASVQTGFVGLAVVQTDPDVGLGVAAGVGAAVGSGVAGVGSGVAGVGFGVGSGVCAEVGSGVVGAGVDGSPQAHPVHTLEQVSVAAIHLGTPPHRSWHLASVQTAFPGLAVVQKDPDVGLGVDAGVGAEVGSGVAGVGSSVVSGVGAEVGARGP